MVMLKRCILSTTACVAIAFGSAGAAQAATTFSTALLGSNEVPPVTTTGFGTGKLFLADDMNSFDVLIDFTGLTSNAVAGHIHCCALPGANAPVAIGFTVPGAMAGTITGTYDLTMASTYTSAFLASSGGTAAGARSVFLSGLNGGMTYFNVHTATNPGGEIRGQVAAVPEPATWGMLILGFGMVGAGIRKKRVKTAIAFG